MEEQTFGFPVRQLLVDLESGFPRHWNGGDAYRSHVLNSLSMMLPQEEQYFIDIARECIPALEARQASELLTQVRGFIGQEATHRRMHTLYN